MTWTEIIQISTQRKDAFHKGLYNELRAKYSVSETSSKKIFKTLKQPLANKSHQAAKILIAVETDSQAISLANELKRKIESFNQDLKMLSINSQLNYYEPVRYKVSIHHAGASDILFSLQPVRRVKKLSGEQIYEMCESMLENCKQSTSEATDLKTIIALCHAQILQSDSDYIFESMTGYAYKLTYYDQLEFRRKQINAGEICIFSGIQFMILKKNTQKQRDDCIKPEEYLYKGQTYSIRQNILHRRKT